MHKKEKFVQSSEPTSSGQSLKGKLVKQRKRIIHFLDDGQPQLLMSVMFFLVFMVVVLLVYTFVAYDAYVSQVNHLSIGRNGNLFSLFEILTGQDGLFLKATHALAVAFVGYCSGVVLGLAIRKILTKLDQLLEWI